MPPHTTEPELRAPLDECLPDGTLHRAAIGYSRVPLHRCNVRGHAGRKKKWNFWCVTSREFLLAITYADLDYLGLAAVWFVDLVTGEQLEKAATIPGGFGFAPPETVRGGDIVLNRMGVALAFREEPGGTRVEAAFRTLRGRRLRANVLIELPAGHESLSVLVPWSPTRFQFTSKHNTRPARGAVTVDGRTYEASAATDAFGCLDFGRGVWPWRTAWNWASASGTQGGRRVGFNLGGKWTDGTGVTENGLCLDGRLHKYGEDLRWTYDRRAFRRPWRIEAPSGCVALDFRPSFGRAQRLELGVLGLDAHVMVGRFSGRFRTDAGEELEVRELLGWAEEFRARW
jgi:hypothetical protein